jgi:pyroglutamyl-peptidase
MNKPERILLYGFGAYREFRENITTKIIKALPPQSGLKKIIFPVRFHRSQFVHAIDRVKPDVVLGLGQSSRHGIDVETQALNRRRTHVGDSSKPILVNGPVRLRTTLRLKVGRRVRTSTNAGDYVCNFSMYVMLDHIRRNGRKIPYGFIHIPHDYDLMKAAGLVEKIVRRL